MENHERLSDGEAKPDSKKIRKTIGNKVFPLWEELRDYVIKSYNIEPDLIFYGKKYGWCYKFRKSSKTLCTLFPEKNSFTVLITLGSRDIEKLGEDLNKLSKYTKNTFDEARLYHDGKWLWIRVTSERTIDDIKLLLNVKRKPISK